MNLKRFLQTDEFKNGIAAYRSGMDTLKNFVPDKVQAGFFDSVRTELDGDRLTVWFYGPIDTLFGIDAIGFVDAIKGHKGPIDIQMSSPGGSVMEALAISSEIRRIDNTVDCYINAQSASAATLVALACDRVLMSSSALFAIHNSWQCMCGNAAEMRTQAELLDKIDNILVNEYVYKSGEKPETIRNWMSEEKVFSASEAEDVGFVDKIIPPKNTDDGETDDSDTDDASASVDDMQKVFAGEVDKARERLTALRGR